MKPRIAKGIVLLLAGAVLFSFQPAEARRMKDARQGLKVRLSSLGLVKFALPRSELDIAIRAFRSDRGKSLELARLVSTQRISQSLNLNSEEAGLLVEILGNYDRYSGSDIYELTGYGKKDFPAFLSLWVEKGPFYKGKAVIYYTNHFGEHDFNAIKKDLESRIKAAQAAGQKIIFINESTGPSITNVELLAQSLGVTTEALLTEEKHRTVLREFFEKVNSLTNSFYDLIERGKATLGELLSPSGGFYNPFYRGLSLSAQFDKPLLKLLAAYRVKTIPEQISFNAWRNYILSDYHRITFQRSIAEGDLEKALYHLKAYAEIAADSVRERDEEFMQFLRDTLKPNTIVLSDRGILHNQGVTSEDAESYTIETMPAYEPYLSPVHKLIISYIDGISVSEIEEEGILYREIINHLVFLFLVNTHPELPGLEITKVAVTISGVWGKEEAVELVDIIKRDGPKPMFVQLAISVIQDESFGPEVRSLFMPPSL